MDKFTTEQLNIAKNFDDQDKGLYNKYRVGGLSVDQSLNAVMEVKTGKPQPKAPLGQRVAEGFLDVVGGKEMAQGAGQALAGNEVVKNSEQIRQQGIKTANAILERLKLAKANGDVNGIEKWTELLNGIDYGAGIVEDYSKDLKTNKEVIGSAIKLGGTAAGAFVGGNLMRGGTVASQGGKLLWKADSLIPKGAIGKVIPGIMAEGAIQGGTYGLGEGITKGESIPKIALDTITNALIGTATAGVLGKGFQLGGRVLSKWGKKGEELAVDAVTGEKIINKKTAKLTDYIKVESPTKGPVDIPTTPKDPAVFETAGKRGYEPKDARFFADIGAEDKPIMQKMQNLSEQIDSGKLPASFTERPIDFVGSKVQKTIGQVDAKLNTFGQELDKVAKNLKGQTIDTNPLTTSLDETLDKYGISINQGQKAVTNGKWNFDRSDFKLLPNTELKKALDDAYSPKADAYDVHIVKRTLDTLIKGAKTGEGLIGESKTIITQLRKNVDAFLDSRYPTYKAVNDKLSDTFKMQRAVEDLFGKNMTTESIGQKFRGIFSNNVSRGATKEFINQLAEYTKKYGIKTQGDIVNLTYFAEKLEDLYGTQAITGLRGNIERALKGVSKAVNIVRNPVSGLLNVAGDVAESIAGQSDNAKRKFIKDLLYKAEVQGTKAVKLSPKAKAVQKLNETKKKLVKTLKGEEIPVKTSKTTKTGKKDSILAKIKGIKGKEGGYINIMQSDIVKTHPDVNLKREVVIRNMAGERVVLTQGEAITPYELKNNRYLIKDGVEHLVPKKSFDVIMQNSIKAEAKEFAPELKGIGEIIKEDKVGALGVGVSRNTKYSQYTLPGGTNYKEILIQAPNKKLGSNLDRLIETEKELGKYGYKIEVDMAGDNLILDRAGEVMDYDALRPEVKRLVDKYEFALEHRNSVDDNAFMGAHWNEPDIAAHIRMNWRKFKDKSVAFLEEIQSDWAREVRKNGTSGVELADNISMRRVFKSEVERGQDYFSQTGVRSYSIDNMPKEGDWALYQDGEFLMALDGTKDLSMIEAKPKIIKAIDNFNQDGEYLKGGAGAFPLKNWQETAVKRALKEAVDSDAEYFSWINGKQTSERYNLATYLEKVSWMQSVDAVKAPSGRSLEGIKEIRNTVLPEARKLIQDGETWLDPKLRTLLQKYDIDDTQLREVLTGPNPKKALDDFILDDGYWKHEQIELESRQGKTTSMVVTPKDRGSKITIKFNNETGKVIEAGKNNLIGKDIDEVVGKGLADKIRASETGSLTDEGLKFGGVWADNLYDKQVGNIVKQLTGANIETMDLGLESGKKFMNFVDGRMTTFTRPEDLKIGMKVVDPNGKKLVVAQVGRNGKFDAIPQAHLDDYVEDLMLDDGWDNTLLKGYKEAKVMFEDDAILNAYDSGITDTYSLSEGINQVQQGIKLTPEVKAIIRGEAPQLKKASGKKPEALAMGGFGGIGLLPSAALLSALGLVGYGQVKKAIDKNTINYTREETPGSPTQEKIPEPTLTKALMQLESSGGTNKANADKGELKWLTGLTEIAINELKRVKRLSPTFNKNNRKEVLKASAEYFNLMQEKNPELTPAEVYTDKYWSQWKTKAERLKKIKEFNLLLKM